MFKNSDDCAKVYKISYNKEPYYIVCRFEKTASGFRHIVSLAGRAGFESVSYINRTWESYDYQTAIVDLFEDLETRAGDCEGAKKLWHALAEKAKAKKPTELF